MVANGRFAKETSPDTAKPSTSFFECWNLAPIKTTEARLKMTGKQELEEEQANEEFVGQNMYHCIKKDVRANKFGSIVDLKDVVTMATNIRTLLMTMENLDTTSADSMLVQSLDRLVALYKHPKIIEWNERRKAEMLQLPLLAARDVEYVMTMYAQNTNVHSIKLLVRSGKFSQINAIFFTNIIK